MASGGDSFPALTFATKSDLPLPHGDMVARKLEDGSGYEVCSENCARVASVSGQKKVWKTADTHAALAVEANYAAIGNNSGTGVFQTRNKRF